MGNFETAIEQETTTEFIFETEEVIEDSGGESSGIKGIIVITSFIFIISIIITMFFVKKKKKKNEQQKQNIKIGSINAKFLKKKEEINNNLDKYAASLLDPYDFSDEGDTEPATKELRDLYMDEQNLREEEKKNIYKKEHDFFDDFIDNDAETIKFNKEKEMKIKEIKETLDDGMSEDIDAYFDKQKQYFTNNNIKKPKDDEDSEWDEEYNETLDDPDIKEIEHKTPVTDKNIISMENENTKIPDDDNVDIPDEDEDFL